MKILSLIETQPLNGAQLAKRLGKSQSTIHYLMEALENDKCVTSQVHRGTKRTTEFVPSWGRIRTYWNEAPKSRVWKATGIPLPDNPTPTPKRGRPSGPVNTAFDCSALLAAWK